jgi:putative membrane protein
MMALTRSSAWWRSDEGLLALLFGLLLTLWVWLAFYPVDRETWVLENVLLVLFVGTLAVTYARFRFSRGAYVLMFVFLCLHTVGAHYTYSLVPYDTWATTLTGGSVSELMGWQRNHFDRLVHFAFGALLAQPARELLVRRAGARGWWSYFLPVVLLMACSSLYELIEWGAALVFGGELGMHYLGTQGDVWDGQRDMALAAVGAVFAMLVAALGGGVWRMRGERQPDGEQAGRAGVAGAGPI